MTQETCTVVDLQDITTIKFDCKCGASQAFHPDGNTSVPDVCRQCGSKWMVQGDTSYELIRKFMDGLRDIRLLKSPEFKLRLTIPVR